MDHELQAIAAMRSVVDNEPTPERVYTPAEAKSILRNAGWSYESCSKVLGVSGRSVAGWLAGEHTPSAPIADRYFRLLAVLDRASAVRSSRLAEGVSRLLEVVRSTPTPVYEEVA